MNKVRIYIIICLVIFAIPSLAQAVGGEVKRKPPLIQKGIERTIDGITIGFSSKENVIAHLKSKGNSFDLHEPTANYTVIVSNGIFNYQGVEWQAVMYKLYENKVFVITYIKGVNKDKANGLILSGAKLNKRISNKYKKYQVKTGNGVYQYQDGKTFMNIELGEEYTELSLGIGDVKVSNLLYNNRTK